MAFSNINSYCGPNDQKRNFGSLNSLAGPPYFLRALREKMTRSLSQACANESSDARKKNHVPVNRKALELMLSMQPLKMVAQIENDVSMRTNDELECLSEIDDLEIDRYLHNEEERRYKKIIWEKLNWDYLKDQAAKEAAAKKGFDGSMAKSQKAKKKRQIQVAKGSGSVQLDPKASHALSKKRLSSKVNFEMVEELFGDSAALENPKKARFETCSENRDNLESGLENKNRGDDELGSTGEFEEETVDMGGFYENTCCDNNVDEGYNYEDDAYDFE